MTLTHDSSTVTFDRHLFTNNVRAWSDRGYVYEDVPAELHGAISFVGPMKSVTVGTLTLLSPHAPGTAYIWSEPGMRDAGFPAFCWDEVGTMHWRHSNGARVPLQIYKKELAAGTSLEIPVCTAWVGGIAFKRAEDPLSADGRRWMAPTFTFMSGEVVPPWEQHGVRSVVDVRLRIAKALGKPPQCVKLVSASGDLIADSDLLPTASDGNVVVTLSQDDMFNGIWYCDSFYTVYGYERHRIQLDDVGLQAVKVIGQHSVPTGQWAWRALSLLQIGQVVEGIAKVRTQRGFKELPARVAAVSLDAIQVNIEAHHEDWMFVRERSDARRRTADEHSGVHEWD